MPAAMQQTNIAMGHACANMHASQIKQVCCDVKAHMSTPGQSLTTAVLRLHPTSKPFLRGITIIAQEAEHGLCAEQCLRLGAAKVYLVKQVQHGLLEVIRLVLQQAEVMQHLPLHMWPTTPSPLALFGQHRLQALPQTHVMVLVHHKLPSKQPPTPALSPPPA